MAGTNVSCTLLSLHFSKLLNERLTTLARVHNLRFVKLHLDGDHVDVVLVFEELRGGLQDLLRVAGRIDREVHGDRVLVRGQGPDAEVVHQDDVEQVHEVGHDVVEAHRLGAALHEDAHRVAHHVDRRAEDDEGEDDGADGIGHLEAGVDVDQDGGDEHADRLDEVAEDVDHGRPDVEVLRRRGVLVVAAGLPAAVVVVMEVTVGALRSRMEFHPQRNERWTLSLSSNELGSRLPPKPSFGPRGLRTCNVFFQKTAGLR